MIHLTENIVIYTLWRPFYFEIISTLVELNFSNNFSNALSGYIIFAIGFADADYGELVNIASKPSDRHVFFVDDLDAVKKIEEQLITFVCEAATASE